MGAYKVHPILLIELVISVVLARLSSIHPFSFKHSLDSTTLQQKMEDKRKPWVDGPFQLISPSKSGDEVGLMI